MNNVIAFALAAGLFAAGIAAGAALVSGQQQPVSEPQQQQDEERDTPKQGGARKKITLVADETVVRVAPDSQLHPGGVEYLAMTFNGTVPGPLIDVDAGDTVEITLTNKGDIVHSLNFHAAVGPKQVLSDAVGPGQSRSWSFVASTPGAFMYHCDGDNLNGIWEHIASGMYGGIVVRSGDERPAREFYVVFGELYNSSDAGMFAGTNGTVGSFDIEKFAANAPDLVLTNGMAYRYIPHFGTASKIALNGDAEEFEVVAGELTRWYVVNAGPRGAVAFNFGAGIIGAADGRPLNDETWSIPPGSAAVIETVFPEEGVYFGNDHDLGRLLAGAGFVVHAARGNSTAIAAAAG